MNTQSQSIVQGAEEVIETYKKKQGYFLFFKTTWWERIKVDSIANDIIIETDRKIRQIILNGKIIPLE